MYNGGVAKASFNRAFGFLYVTRNQVIYLWADWRFGNTDWKIELTYCKIRGWLVDRGERLIKLGDSWFSAKIIEVMPLNINDKR